MVRKLMLQIVVMGHMVEMVWLVEEMVAGMAGEKMMAGEKKMVEETEVVEVEECVGDATW